MLGSRVSLKTTTGSLARIDTHTVLMILTVPYSSYISENVS